MTNPSSNAGAAAARQKNWLLAKFRKWHAWGGLIAALFLLLVGLSGIVLNYKKPLFTALGLESTPAKTELKTNKSVPEQQNLHLTTAGGIHSMPISLERAFELVRAQWGDVPLERIELKLERGQFVYKFKNMRAQEIWINAATGQQFAKGEYERIAKSGADGAPVRTTDWGKILLDLHTGKIGGSAGKAVMSLAALLLVFLSLSGIYMWAKPLLIRRANSRFKQTLTASSQRSGAPAASAKPMPRPFETGPKHSSTAMT